MKKKYKTKIMKPEEESIDTFIERAEKILIEAQKVLEEIKEEDEETTSRS